MTKTKKIIASAIAVACMGTMSMSAFADTYTKRPVKFNLSSNSYAWSSGAEKEDDLDYATLYTEGGYVSTSKPIHVTIYKTPNKSNVNRVSETVKVTSPSDKYRINYTTHRGTGSYNYLLAETGYYSAEISGYWYP